MSSFWQVHQNLGMAALKAGGGAPPPAPSSASAPPSGSPPPEGKKKTKNEKNQPTGPIQGFPGWGPG
ncbi:hypothetical protein SeLEV6574_g08205 [Synchytrium endobioticum]|uniref:Uncharacterized protein n=1 Tax=Synchytrium endobioticum TaxID=286115 RepID=A0A507C6D9_9FUNG|nr:hypothetical protein SeLEV6574_g08205 [Synchytrium endobioticum]